LICRNFIIQDLLFFFYILSHINCNTTSHSFNNLSYIWQISYYGI